MKSDRDKRFEAVIATLIIIGCALMFLAIAAAYSGEPL
jgi:hypothetical protein